MVGGERKHWSLDGEVICMRSSQVLISMGKSGFVVVWEGAA